MNIKHLMTITALSVMALSGCASLEKLKCGCGEPEAFPNAPDEAEKTVESAFIVELDTDGDGVFDSADQCLSTAAGVKVDAKGCAMDSDGDGVKDGVDRCPVTPAGTTVDSAGCAVPTAYTVSNSCKSYIDVKQNRLMGADPILFATNSADVSAKGKKILACVADFATVNKAKLEVAGYTDSVGSKEYNQRLSQRRAGNARAILVSEGVREGQVKVRGYGMASLKGKGNNAASRRVEVKQLN